MNKQSLLVLGKEGSYTGRAAESFKNNELKHLDVELKYGYPDAFKIIEEIGGSRKSFGVIPIYNSIRNQVSDTLDDLIKSSVRIMAEEWVLINHVLACHPDSEELNTVSTHPQAYFQVKPYLRGHYGSWIYNFISAPSTSHAAMDVMEHELKSRLVVCSEESAKTYGLKILEKNFLVNNKTRFLLLGNKTTNPTGRDKTSITFETRNVPAALYKVLGVFAEHDINLAYLQSLPNGESSLFYLEFENHASNVWAVLKELKQYTNSLVNHGSYPDKSKNLNNKTGVDFSNGL
jgi:prephenate dehydratase